MYLRRAAALHATFHQVRIDNRQTMQFGKLTVEQCEQRRDSGASGCARTNLRGRAASRSARVQAPCRRSLRRLCEPTVHLTVYCAVRVLRCASWLALYQMQGSGRSITAITSEIPKIIRYLEKTEINAQRARPYCRTSPGESPASNSPRGRAIFSWIIHWPLLVSQRNRAHDACGNQHEHRRHRNRRHR